MMVILSFCFVIGLDYPAMREQDRGALRRLVMPLHGVLERAGH